MLTKIINAKSAREPVRMWIPACSTGQEAYSLAILMMEVLGEKATASVQIFATDLSEQAINKARLGIYSKDEVAGILPRRLDRFFIKVDSSYRIIKSIRDLCIFATHNVLKDPPFSRLDLISCCNLLIYLEPALQKKLMATFHYSLNSTGYLVLGKSETIANFPSLFTQVDKKHKVYAKKKDVVSKALFELSYSRYKTDRCEIPGKKNIVTGIKSEDIDLDRIVDQVLLKKYTPACVVINSDMDIVQFRGSTGLFLEPAPGKASLNLLKMARPGLGFELRNIVFKTSRSGEPEEKTWIEKSHDNRTRKLSIEVLPIKHNGGNLEQYYLVVFNEEYLASQDENLHPAGKDHKVKLLEAELNALKEDMRTIVEEQEAANQELQSVNEEIVSSNEELQSINEELETSKEEVESSNEELVTINQELQMRNEQLAEIQEYSEAVFTTIRESLLILDKDLRVKNANSCFYKTFHMTQEETEGKFLYDLGDRQWSIPRLKELLEEIIPRNSQMEDFEVTHYFKNVGEKIMVLNARRLMSKLQNQHFILLAIEDITQYRQVQQMIANREEWFRNMADNSPVMIWVADTEKKLQFVNKAWLEYRDKELAEAVGQNWIEDVHPDDEKRIGKLFDDSFARQKPFTSEYRLKHGNEYKLILVKGNPNYSHDQKFIGFIGSCVELPT